MFSKIKSIFGKSEPVTIQNNPQKFDHSNIGASGATQCPFMKKKAHQNGQKNDLKGANKSGKVKQGTEVESQSQEDEKPRGGCPFMGGSDRKKNPSLPLNNQAFDEPFVSKFKYYLSANKMDFSMKGKGKVHHRSRLMFDQYPIYLQHTIFFNGEDYKKVRGLQCCSRFMAYEQLRQKGNKYYNKGRYYEALQFYERAMSLFRWLEYHQQLNQSKMNSEVGLLSSKSIDQSSDNNSVNESKIHIELQKEGEEMQFKQMNDLKQKYKQFFIIYCDENVKEYNGEQLEQTADIDMRKSLLIQIYLNMAATYINLNHYTLAEQIVNDGIALSERVSQLYFRKAQSIAMRKDADYQKLLIAQKCINKALQMRPNQKIFTTANINILKMLNLHDAQQAYQACSSLVNQRLIEIEKKNTEVKNMIYERAVQINKIQKRMIEEGKTPRENLDTKMLYNTTEMKILQRMFKKYVRVLQFYTQAKNKEQIMLAKKEFQQILKIGWEVKIIFDMKIEEQQNELGGLYTDKIEKRINSIKTRFADQIYNQGKFNFTMLEWVIKEIVKEQAQEQKLRKEQEMQNKGEQTSEMIAGEKNGLTKKLPYLLLLLPLLIIMASFFLI